MTPGLREAVDRDSGAIVALIGGCFAEYPGCVLDLPGIDAWMLTPATAFATGAGRLWVVERDGAVVACVGLKPAGPGRAELKSLYVAAAARGQGLGADLVQLAEDAARGAGAAVVELWSDSRFADAHRLYERLGYTRGPQLRALHDPSDTTEYFFDKALS
ncbi:MAG: GNAT family N-acetyltransferase [Geodermatophilaceae bacterium]|nr:GNAT family N-acetyltransferase [Geodermatophilaceae bacterium]